MRALLMLFAALLFALPAAAQENGEIRRYFRDWLAACRADGYCSAIAYVRPNSGGGRDADYWLRVGRHAEGVYWEVSFTTIAAQADPWRDFTVDVDGNSTTFSLSPEVGAYGSANDFYFLGDKAQEVMDRFGPGRTATISFTDTDGNTREAVFSLSGLTAALLWIDEQQHRIGSERVASAPPVGLVPIGEGAEAPAHVPAALLDRHRGDAECEPLEELANGRDIESFDLGDGQQVYFLPCWSAAYNFGWKVYVGSAGDFWPQYFAYYGGMGWSGTPFVVNYAYDPQTHTLRDFNKGRGVGDCGSQGSWVWDSYAFRLTEYRYRDCGEEIDERGELLEFPLVFGPPSVPPPRSRI